MQALKSKTIKFNLIMAALTSLNATFMILEPILAPQTFLLSTVMLAMVQSMGSVYLRMITTKPVNDL